MTTSVASLLTACSIALGDSDNSTWARETVLLPWIVEAVKSFPILRPQSEDYVSAIVAKWFVSLPTDFREVISVERPVNQQPKQYLYRKYRLDHNFYDGDEFFDVDQDYTRGTGFLCYFSKQVAINEHVYIEYLADHDTALTDSAECFITVPDQYVDILIYAVTLRAYRERLAVAMQDPTAFTTTIQQFTLMVRDAEKIYLQMIKDAQDRISSSIIMTSKKVDRFDRVY